MEVTLCPRPSTWYWIRVVITGICVTSTAGAAVSLLAALFFGVNASAMGTAVVVFVLGVVVVAVVKPNHVHTELTITPAAIAVATDDTRHLLPWTDVSRVVLPAGSPSEPARVGTQVYLRVEPANVGVCIDDIAGVEYLEGLLEKLAPAHVELWSDDAGHRHPSRLDRQAQEADEADDDEADSEPATTS